MSKKHQLAELQLAIMQVLWERGEASVGEVREALHLAVRRGAVDPPIRRVPRVEQHRPAERAHQPSGGGAGPAAIAGVDVGDESAWGLGDGAGGEAERQDGGEGPHGGAVPRGARF